MGTIASRGRTDALEKRIAALEEQLRLVDAHEQRTMRRELTRLTGTAIEGAAELDGLLKKLARARRSAERASSSVAAASAAQPVLECAAEQWHLVANPSLLVVVAAGDLKLRRCDDDRPTTHHLTGQITIFVDTNDSFCVCAHNAERYWQHAWLIALPWPRVTATTARSTSVSASASAGEVRSEHRRVSAILAGYGVPDAMPPASTSTDGSSSSRRKLGRSSSARSSSSSASRKKKKKKTMTTTTTTTKKKKKKKKRRSASDEGIIFNDIPNEDDALVSWASQPPTAANSPGHSACEDEEEGALSSCSVDGDAVDARESVPMRRKSAGEVRTSSGPRMLQV